MRLVKATAECPYCGTKKHQIDGTEERALQVVRSALERHIAEDHPGKIERPAPCEWCPYPECDCAELLAAGTTHTRKATDQGPDYCYDCSEAIRQWVQWPCPGARADR